MTDAPERIWARPVGATRDWSHSISGPWSLESPYGTSVEYVRADMHTALEAEVARLREALHKIAVVWVRDDLMVNFAVAKKVVDEARAALSQGE